MKNVIACLLFQLLAIQCGEEAQALKYNWKAGVDGLITRCFEAAGVKVHCEDFSEPSRGRDYKNVKELQIEAGIRFAYSYERAWPGELCEEHLKKIRSLMRNANEVCITGVAEWLDVSENVTNAKWRALETKRGWVTWALD